MSNSPQVEYLAHTRIGEKGQLTIPKSYRDELGLETGAPLAVLRVGEGLILIPEQNRFRELCDSIASAFEERHVSPADLVKSLPEARRRVFFRRYGELAKKESGTARSSRRR